MTAEHLTDELISAAELAISTGRRLRSDPGTHELSLAMLCNVMGRIAETQAKKLQDLPA